jgi:hypothetical protein
MTPKQLGPQTPGHCRVCEEPLRGLRTHYCSKECCARAQVLRNREVTAAASPGGFSRELCQRLDMDERRELRQRALSLLRASCTGTEVARALQVKRCTIYKWASRARRAGLL